MAIKIKVSDEARNYARKVIKNYLQNVASVNQMEQALRCEWRETDENIGGGRTSVVSSPIEAEFDRVWSNKEFARTVKEINAFEKVWNSIEDDIAKKVIEERYFNLEVLPNKKRRMQTWVKVAHRIDGCSEDTCRKMEKAIVESLVNELDLV